MAATADQLAVIRSWVGSTPDDDTVNGIFDRLGSVAATALEILRGRLASFTPGPGKLSVAGHMSYDNVDIIKLLTSQVADLEALVVSSGDGTGAPAVIRSGRLVRANRLR